MSPILSTQILNSASCWLASVCEGQLKIVYHLLEDVILDDTDCRCCAIGNADLCFDLGMGIRTIDFNDLHNNLIVALKVV